MWRTSIRLVPITCYGTGGNTMATLLKKVVAAHYGHAIRAADLPERIVVKDSKGRLVLLTKPAHVANPDTGKAFTKAEYEAKGFVVVPDGESKALKREAFLAMIASK